MPKVGRKPQVNKKPTVANLTCLACGKTKKTTEFSVSSSVFNAGTGRVQYCRECCLNMSCDDNGDINIQKLKNTLEKIDKPFLKDVLQSSYEESKSRALENGKETHPLSLYFKTINSLPQYKNLTWKDSCFESSEISNDIINKGNSNNKPDSFQPDDFIYEKWGYGYSNDEYYYFEKKWKKLIDNYGEKTSFHVEGLLTYIRFRVKEELATARGDYKEAKEWGSMASKAADDAKINVRQLSKSDISGGIELLPQLFEAIESKIGAITIMPKLKEQPYDDADLIIWCILNYIRRLDGKSRVSYREIWKFYDEMLEEYYKSQGYSDINIQKEKEKRNNIFRDLEDVYKEPIYEEGED